jgi:hypothetical protein
MNQLWHCLDLEGDFTTIKRDNAPYLKNADALIAASDSSQLCSLVAQYSRYNVTVGVCDSIQNQVIDKGESVAH